MELAIGKKIKSLRAQKGITQEELANYLNISCQAVSKWENETTSPDIQMLPGISTFFGVTIDEAKDILEKVKAFGPHPENAMYAGDLAYAAGNPKEAESLWNQGIEETPDDWIVYFLRADRYQRAGQYEKAIQLYKDSFNRTKKPRLTDALEACAFLYEQLGQYKDSINMFEFEIQTLGSDFGITSGILIDDIKTHIKRITIKQNEK